MLLAGPLLWITRHRFPLTTLLTTLIAMHCVILCVGGHYTYARVPAGDWAADVFGFERNHYDRLGHFFQGFEPAILTREILARASPLRGSRWMGFLCAAVSLAFSAFYELIEWWTAALSGAAAEDFLGTQGDVWDTQWDMGLALLGAVCALTALTRRHDVELNRLTGPA